MAEPASILVALATYNEIENLPTLVTVVHEFLPTVDIVVIDDNSPDGTGQWCDDFAKQHDWFSVLHRAKKLGLGTALTAAMQKAMAEDYQSLITLDADWSHPPDRLPAIVEASKIADVVIGSRYCEGGEIEGWPRRRRLASRLINFFTRKLLDTPVNDCSGNYRLYSTSVLSKISWEDLHAEGYAFIEEVLWHLHRQGAIFTEVPVRFTDRKAGNSKLNYLESLGALRTLLGLFWNRLTSRP